ncbi:hypothetical protein [Pseudogemmobacter sp. W21_MBD1_M6]|uniref:hypothetical protein n=1 Tax=Pseudogemmobacter sp. W21_MBD1_M6 TaxID=3240271 RepID=UPI003F94B5B0
MSPNSFFLTSGSMLALVLASSVQAEPVVDPAQCAVDAVDCIVITQSADSEAVSEPGVAANTADVTLDGTQTTILAYEGVAQSGNGNAATFDITGDQNTFLFAQTGNSLLAITVNGGANTVGLFELGGVADRLASLTLDVAGDANTVDILSQRAAIAADLLDIEILGMNNILEVKFEDYAKILTSIMGDGNTAKIAQNTQILASGSSAVTLMIQGAESTNNIVNILQNGLRQTVDASLNGSQNTLDLVQDGPASMDNRIDVSLSGIANAAVIAQTGAALETSLDLTGAESRNNIVNIGQGGMSSSVAVILNGADNRLDLLQAFDVDFIFGFDNRMDVKLSGIGNDASISHMGRDNATSLDLEGDDNTLDIAQRLFTNVGVVQRGSSNLITLNIDTEQNALFDLRGDRNDIDLRIGRGRFDYYWSEPSRVMTIAGNDNHVRQFVDGMESGRSKVVIAGDGNTYDMTEFGFDPGSDDGSGVLRETVDILGSGNNLSFHNFDSFGGNLALDARVRGNLNSVGMDQSVGLSVDVEGFANQMRFDRVRAADYGFRAVGDNNIVDIRDSVLKNSATWILGNDNVLNAYGLAPREFHNEIAGDSNWITFNDFAGISEMFAYQTVIAGSQNVLTVGSAHEGTYDPADYVGTVMLLGDRNAVSVTHGLASFDVNLVGSDHKFDVSYDPALNAYTHAVTAVGSGSAVFTSENGVVTITRSGA